jgi:hypothetical protein
VGVGYGAAVEEAAGAESFAQDGGEAFEFAGGGGRGFFERLLEFGGGFCVAREFVEADRYGLAQVHRAVLCAGGDAQQPVAVAQIFVGQAGFFRAEQERDAIFFTASGALARKTLQNDARASFERAQRMMQFAAAGGCGADYQRAIRDRFRNGAELFGARENRRSAYGRTRFAICGVVGIHQAQMRAAEIAHGASGGANIQRIARRDEDDAKIVQEGRRIHERLFYGMTRCANESGRGRRTSMFQVQIAGKIQAGPYVVRGVSDQSIVLPLDEQQLRQSKLFATSLGERRFGMALRRKRAGNEWEVLDAQSNGPLGALTPEIEGNLQQLLAAPAEMLQK